MSLKDNKYITAMFIFFFYVNSKNNKNDKINT